ncbi:MAG: nucleotide exchange factor GrpE [Mariprofundales bacterium]
MSDKDKVSKNIDAEEKTAENAVENAAENQTGKNSIDDADGGIKGTISELVDKAVDKAKNVMSSKDAKTTEDDENSDADIIQDLQKKLEKAEAEAIRMRNEWLRAKAETENVRRRSQREVGDARKYAIEPFAKELLSVADNLQRALDAATSDNTDASALQQGVKLTSDDFVASMEKFGVKRIDTAGEKFDPQFHEALAKIPHDEIVEDYIIMQHAAGYTLRGRLLRPASVVVSSGEPEVATE